MGNKKCKEAKNDDADQKKNNNGKYKCKKCDRIANKEKKLCKPSKQ